MTAPPREPTTGTGTGTGHSYGARVAALEREALTRLAEAAGDRSLCLLSRDGSAYPAAKYHEGAVAALAQARRALTAAHAGAEPVDPVQAVRARWRPQDGGGTTGAAWRAYHEGGRDALDALLAVGGARTSTSGAVTAERTTTGPVVHPTVAAGGPTADRARTAAGAVERSAPARRSGGGQWPRRRVAAAVVLAPVVFALLVAAGGGLVSAAAPWTVLVALAAAVAAATLATYVPARGAGRRPDVGCSPCAAMSAVSVLVAAWLLHAAPHQPTMAAAAVAAVGIGLLQRLTPAGASCTT